MSRVRKRKNAGVVSEFLKEHYGIGWRDISSKLRSALLTELDHVVCNLCGEDSTQPIAQRDKYSLTLTTVMCRNCGLMYLNPRPAASAYRRFYEEGGGAESVYHRRVNFSTIGDLLKVYYGPDFEMDANAREAMRDFMARKGVGIDMKPLAGAKPQPSGHPDGKDEADHKDKSVHLDQYGVYIYEMLKKRVPMGGKVFEPGASHGKMLAPWAKLHGCEATGVEPKREAVQMAKKRYGLDLIQGFADDPAIPESEYDLVLNTRTINHMLDPLGDLRNAWRWLKPDGLLFVDIQDTIEETRYEGFERNVVEIDHPYMFSQRSLNAMVQKAGFRILESGVQDLQSARDWDNREPEVKQIRIVAQKATSAAKVDWPDPMAELAALMTAQLAFDRGLKQREDKDARKKRTKTKKQTSGSRPGFWPFHPRRTVRAWLTR